ncbi:MAG: prepilin-type N-terminal cleavage/methylation domain-containing protein, partial [Gammaproteobacteria bacterium]|nr:prepilin-type N-terminal cleavage/methylation domain-containing protein [Gammaproteobacteria bacterium]
MRNSSGFSLIELLLVTLIIGILATIAIPRLTAARDRAFVATMQADLRNLATQQEIHYADELTYSNDFDDLAFSSSDRVTVTSMSKKNISHFTTRFYK